MELSHYKCLCEDCLQSIVEEAIEKYDKKILKERYNLIKGVH